MCREIEIGCFFPSLLDLLFRRVASLQQNSAAVHSRNRPPLLFDILESVPECVPLLNHCSASGIHDDDPGVFVPAGGAVRPEMTEVGDVEALDQGRILPARADIEGLERYAVEESVRCDQQRALVSGARVHLQVVRQQLEAELRQVFVHIHGIRFVTGIQLTRHIHLRLGDEVV